MADTEQRLLVDGEGGLHRDGEKPRLADYLDWKLILEAGEIAAMNCAKNDDYPEGKYPDLPGGIPNFKGGIRVSKMLDSAMRHLIAVLLAEDVDPESHKRHIAHIICNLSMVSWTLANRGDLDDRQAKPAGPGPKVPEAIIERIGGASPVLARCPLCGIVAWFASKRVGEVHHCPKCQQKYRLVEK